MVSINASFRSVEAEIVSYQAQSQRQSLAVQIRGEPEKSSLLNAQQQQIVDDVGISAQAIEKFEQAQELAQQLQNYVDYLYGREPERSVKIAPVNDEPSVTIAAESTKLSASITAGRITEKTLDISAELDDEGNLESLSITKTETNIEFISAQISLQNTKFYAQS